MAQDTIYALASAPGRCGVAVVRVSGSRAGDSLRALIGSEQAFPAPRRACLRDFSDSVSRETIDRGLVVWFPGPASFTGEDVAEYSLHGGPAVVRGLLDVLARQEGHRLAQPGEFTKRAFEHGKLDLTEAEAVGDLVHAETALQRSQALAQLGGALKRLYEGWAERLTRSLAHLEADLDFPDEDLPEGVGEAVRPALLALIAEMAAHLDDHRRGERVRDGFQVAILGAPNAGKSSLINLLARRDVAIVSDVPGTTRDVIEVHLDVRGWPVVLADTAGVRPEDLLAGDHGRIEAEGIRRALQRAEAADIRVLLFDGAALPELDAQTLSLADARSLVVVNKCDAANSALIPAEISGQTPVRLSALTGAGLEDLLAALESRLEALSPGRESPTLTRARHREALDAARASLERALDAPLPELMAEDVRLAVRALGQITGRVDVEALLDVIFRDFCIGK